ncbi:MAG: phage portal protein [Phycisphaerales bacterium]
MGLLSTIFGRGPAARQQQRGVSRRLILRAGFDAAKTTDENRRHWAEADCLSADAAATPEVRRILRARARYEAANNSYAKGIVATLANDCVGTGPRLQVLTDDPEANAAIETEFAAWAKAIDLPGKLRTMRMAKAVDGEAFALLTTNPEIASAVLLDLRLVEADQVTTPSMRLTAFANDTTVDGIEFDAFGNPTFYHVLRAHPGAMFGVPTIEFNRVPATGMVHVFRIDRPGQSRGVPEITPALPLFAQLRRYTLAVLGAAETAADFAGILYTDAPAAGEAESIEPMDTVELESRALVTMPAGWKMGQVDAKQPSTTYGEFKREVLNEIARCLNMPFNVAAGNSASYNYASGRLDHQTYFKAIRVERSEFESRVLDRILNEWIREAARALGIIPSALRDAMSVPHAWFWDGHEHVDPAKEATAQSTRLASHTTTLAAEYARMGLDWEDQIRQRAKEIELMDELGLVAAGAPTNDKTAVMEDDNASDQ